MASIDKRRGKWRAQVRRNGHAHIRTFVPKMDADAWVREADIAIDQERDPSVRRVSKKDTFASIIDLHIDDLTSYGKPIRRSKDAVLRRLRADLGDLPVAHLTRERIVQFGRDRASAVAGPATLAVDISFIGTVLTHAAAVHGCTSIPALQKGGSERPALTQRFQSGHNRPILRAYAKPEAASHQPRSGAASRLCGGG